MKQTLAVLVMLVCLTACGDSAGPDTEANISGTYTLRTINGQNLPFAIVVIGTTYRLEVMSANVVVNANGSYTQSMTVRETEGSTTTTQTDASNGTWTRTNNAISFVQTSDGAVVTGSLSGDAITVVDGSFTYVFRK
ncbi:MAG TPA: hypothetical protein VMM78_19505 [Thermomicrobiales bacterium]|nr:hypothetical protein [Thermomicrobiales bacterium]